MNLKNRLRLYDKGEEKFIQEFDAVKFTKSMRNLQTLVTSMIDDNEQFMIPYQKRHTIPLNSDFSNTDESDFEKIPKIFDTEQMKKLHMARVDDFMVLAFSPIG